jgi:hypothetical protein
MVKHIRIVDILVAMATIVGLYMFFYGIPAWVQCGSLTPRCIVYTPVKVKASENRPPGTHRTACFI